MSEIELMDIIAGNLQSLMIEKKIGQNELARCAGIDKSTISRYLNGKILPSLSSLINVCYVLECPLDEIVPCYDLIE